MGYGFDPESPGAVRLREQVRLLREESAPVIVEMLSARDSSSGTVRVCLPDGSWPAAGERVSVPARVAQMLVETGHARRP
jgi:hypothetical protein